MCDQLVDRGAEPILLPTIDFKPMEDHAELDRAIRSVDSYDWLDFTSVNGVSAFWERLVRVHGGAVRELPVQIAAIGPATAEALRSRGFRVRHVPEEYVAESF